MQYTIKHTCGHSEVVQIYGTNSHGERERKSSWMESKPCRECERVAQTATAKTQAEAMGLPTLTGSEKQVAWAESLRAEVVRLITKRVDEQAARTPVDREHEVVAARSAFAEAIAKHTDARWWIDNRFAGFRALATDYEAAFASRMAEHAEA